MTEGRATDEELIRRCQAGEEAAFTALYERHRTAVMRFAHRYVRDRDLAADVLQETFAYFFRKIPTWRFEARVTTLLFQVARNLSLNLKDRRRVRAAASLDDVAEVPDGAEPARAAEKADLARHAREALDTLPDIYREAVTLRILEGLGYEEIGRILDCPAGTVKSRVHNGLELLRKCPGLG